MYVFKIDGGKVSTGLINTLMPGPPCHTGQCSLGLGPRATRCTCLCHDSPQRSRECWRFHYIWAVVRPVCMEQKINRQSTEPHSACPRPETATPGPTTSLALHKFPTIFHTESGEGMASKEGIACPGRQGSPLLSEVRGEGTRRN